MCTAISLSRGDCFFGRTLDLEYHYNETVTIAPRHFPFISPSTGSRVEGGYAIIGMATVADGYPLYYDAMNEQGLCMAGLHFPGNSVYLEPMERAENLPPYALIPRILSSCATLSEAKTLLSRICLIDRPFSSEYPLTPLHWMISKDGQSLVVEPLADGLRIYDNPVSVLANNPEFPAQLAGLTRYLGLSPKEPQDHLADPTLLPPGSRGLGALGMPGDYSSPSRFIRGVFVRQNTPALQGDTGIVQFFRMMEAVALPRGVVEASDRRPVYTIYTSCCDPVEMAYHYTTNETPTITGVRLSKDSMNASALTCYPLRREDGIIWEK